MRKGKPAGVGQRYGAMAAEVGDGDGILMGFDDALLWWHPTDPISTFLRLCCSFK